MWWVLLVACAPRSPSASITGVRVLGVGWEELEGEVSVAVDNPTWVEVPVSGLSWRLDVDGHPVAHGERTDTPPLAADSTTVVTVPVVVRWSALGEALASSSRVAVPWVFGAALVVSTPGGEVSLPVERTGHLPRLAPPSVDGLSVGLEGASVVVDVALGLPLPAGCALDALGWELTVESLVVGAGSALAPAGRPVLLHARFDGGAALWAAWSAVRTFGATVGVSVEGALSTPLGTIPLRGTRTVAVGRG